MEIIFVDTSFFVAYHSFTDIYHEPAIKFVKSLDEKKVTFVTSDYIVDELLTLVLTQSNKQKAIDAGLAILKDPNIEIQHVTENVFDKAWDIFVKFVDKEWSFTDCTSYVLMKELSIHKGASFDEHFRQFGFKIVP